MRKGISRIAFRGGNVHHKGGYRLRKQQLWLVQRSIKEGKGLSSEGSQVSLRRMAFCEKEGRKGERGNPQQMGGGISQNNGL